MTEQSWQYITHLFTEMELQQELDDLGSAGWELVTAQWEPYSLGGRSHMQARCILKRPAPIEQLDKEEIEQTVERTLLDAGRYERVGID